MSALNFWLLTIAVNVVYGLVYDTTIDRLIAPIYWVGFTLLAVRYLKVNITHD